MVVTIKNESNDKLYLSVSKYDSNKYLSLSNYDNANTVKFLTAYDSLDVNINSDGTAPIPNQLLSGEYSGDIPFTVSFYDTVYYQGVLKIIDAEKPENYTLIKTRTIKDNDSQIIDTFYNYTESSDLNKLKRIINYITIKKINISGIKLNFILDSYDKSDFKMDVFTNYINLEEIIFDEETCILPVNSTTNPSTLDLSTINFSFCFSNCRKLKSINLNIFKGNVPNSFKRMCYSCWALVDFNLGDIDTSSVTDLSYMFDHCTSLTSLNLSNFVTSSVTDMFCMFNSCTSLTSLDLSNFVTSSVTDMSYMFYYCTSLANLTLGQDWGINTEITSLDLSYCPLTHDSCLDVFNKLATRGISATLKLKSTTKALMSEDEIAIATNKNWVVE